MSNTTPTQPAAQKTTFGLPSLFKETPKIANIVFRVVLYLAMGTAFVVMTFTEIPAPKQLLIARICTEVTIAVHGLTRMFGITITTPPDPNDASKS